MYVNRCLRAHATRHSARKGPAGRNKNPQPVQTRALPNAKGLRPAGRDPLKRTYAQASRAYFTACLRAERTAASMALLVTVAPATPSIWSLWAASTCWA